MANGFMLKDASGRIKGYIEQTDGAIRCKYAADHPSLLLLVFKDESTHWVNLIPDQGDIRIENPERKPLCAGYVVEKQQIGAATGRLTGFVRKEILRLAVEWPDTQKTKEVIVQTEALEKRSICQRCWPINPCCPAFMNENGPD